MNRFKLSTLIIISYFSSSLAFIWKFTWKAILLFWHKNLKSQTQKTTTAKSMKSERAAAATAKNNNNNNVTIGRYFICEVMDFHVFCWIFMISFYYETCAICCFIYFDRVQFVFCVENHWIAFRNRSKKKRGKNDNNQLTLAISLFHSRFVCSCSTAVNEFEIVVLLLIKFHLKPLC